MTHSAIAVLLVDDHQVLRAGLRALLEDENDMRVVAEAGTENDAVHQFTTHQPDVIVMDLGLPGGSGLEAIKRIRLIDENVRIVVLSMHSGRELVMQALKAGSDGYVPKSAAHTNLLHAIRTVYGGQRYLHPEAATAVIDELMDDQAEAHLLNDLSEREREVLRLCAMGYTSREIGLQLALSPKTVDTYRLRAMQKLELNHRPDLIRFALRAGLLDK